MVFPFQKVVKNRSFFGRILLMGMLACALVGCATPPPITDRPTPRPEPQVSSGMVAIIGHEVHRSGEYPWHSGMTTMELIKTAGGLSEFGGRSYIRVTHSDGASEYYRYHKILKGETKDPVLQPGDRVHLSTPFA
jgi:hypothetical protein